jgi:hypothetical protein
MIEAAEAVFDARSNDSIVLAQAALQAAIRGLDDLAALIDSQPRPQPRKATQAPVSAAVGLSAAA